MSLPKTARFVTQAFAPTEEQLRIQTSAQPTLLIEAAAGAAKTSTLALRIAESLALGTDPRSMLALTFTPTAVLALRQTLRLIGVAAEPLAALRIESCDAYATAVLKRLEGRDARRPVQSLSRPEQLKPHVWQAVADAADNPVERYPEELNPPTYGSDAYVGQFLRRIEGIKGRLLLELHPADSGDSPDYAADELGLDYGLLRMLRSYEALRWPAGEDHPLFRGPLDASYDLARLLLDPDTAALPLGDFDELFVDEMHDCNEAMFTILKALLRREPAPLFCAVGDRHQVIHQHSGADARFMGQALDQETGRSVQRLPLSQSFRYGASVAGWMSRHTGKPVRAAAERSTELQTLSYGGPGESDQPSCEEVLVAALQRWRREQRREAVYASCAVLLRHESQSVLIENALHAHGITHRFMGFGSYLQRPEVLFVRSVYAIASGRLDTLGGAATRALIPAALFEMTQARIVDEDDPDHESADAFVREAAGHAAESEQVIASLFSGHVMARSPAPVRRRLELALASVRQGAGFEAFLAALDMPAFARAVFVEQQRRDEVQRHMQGLLAAARQQDSVLEFFRRLQALDEANARRLADHAAGKVRSNKLALPAITLASAAHVKGLEFEHVLLPYLEQGVFPQARAELADERNLFYVAVTRARQRLSLMVPAARPSAFLAALP
ncbi:ATP-dependent helicase [Paucibacter sp. O1-1]|nr:ATP-dependent helicase [Paucibacter sp. O1-1]MDA3826799.1 ATP-dependent helicase [Paucibacter sp. O1-1]